MTPRLLLSIAAMFALRLLALALVDRMHPNLAQDYCQWDCSWYLQIVRSGYELRPETVAGMNYGQANWAFFPLFPILVRLTAVVMPVSVVLAGFITANLFLLLFVVMAVLYLPRRRPGADPLALAAFLLAFPYGLYFSVPYTESLFAFLAIAALFSLSVQPLAASAVFSGLISAARVPGVLFTPIIAIRAIGPVAAAWRAGDRRLAFGSAMAALLPIALAPLGLAMFMAYLYAHMGDGLAFAHVQAGWYRYTGSPFATLFDGLRYQDWRDAFAASTQCGAMSEVAAIAGLVLAGRLFLLRLWPEGWVLAGTIFLALSAGLVSMPRFVFANPVFLVFLFDWLWQSAWFRRCYLPFLAACALLQLYFARCWLEGYAFLL